MQEIVVSNKADSELSYGQLIGILRRRIRWVGWTAAGSLLFAGLYTLIERPAFESSMQLLVEPNVNQTVNLNDLASGQTVSSYPEVELDYITQLNLMRSSPFLEQALSLLLDEFPDYCRRDSWQDCLEDFEESLQLTRLEEDQEDTRIFEATIAAPSKASARRSLQILRDIYLEYNLTEQEERLTEGLQLVDGQIGEVRNNLRQAQAALQELRQGEGIVDPSEQSLVLSESLDEIVSARRKLESDYEEALAQRAEILGVLNIDADTAIVAARASQSERYQNLLDELQALEVDIAEQETIYTQASPVVQGLWARREQYLALLQAEVQRIASANGGLGVSGEADLLAFGQLVETDVTLVEELLAVQVNVSSLEARRENLAKSEESQRDRLNRFVGLIDEYERLQPEVVTLRSSLEQLLETRQELSNELAQGGFKWNVVEPPSVAERVAPNPIQNLALGAVAGLFIGGLLAYGREALDTSLRTVRDLQAQTALPVLGRLPKDRFGLVNDSSASLFFRSAPPSEKYLYYSGLAHSEPFSDAFALMFKSLQLSTQAMSSVMVTSANSGEGKTTTAVGLALSAARSQQRVLLVDANLRAPSLHDEFGLPNTVGLTQGLESDEAVLPETLSVDGVLLDVLTAGPLSGDPVFLLGSDRMKALAESFEQQYDLVVFDASSILGKVDALQVASLCDSVVLVCQLGRITQVDLVNTLTILSPVNACGIVANGVVRSASSPLLSPEMKSAVRGEYFAVDAGDSYLPDVEPPAERRQPASFHRP